MRSRGWGLMRVKKQIPRSRAVQGAFAAAAVHREAAAKEALSESQIRSELLIGEGE